MDRWPAPILAIILAIWVFADFPVCVILLLLCPGELLGFDIDLLIHALCKRNQ